MSIVSNLSQFGYIKKPVRAVATSNVTIASPGASIGGVTFALSDPNRRVLLTAELSASDNGIYDWNGDSVPLTRSLDASLSTMFLSGFVVAVSAGTGVGAVYQYQGASNPTIGTDSISFVRANPSTTLTVRDIDGTPSISATTLEFTNGTVSDQGSGVARVTIPSSVTVSEQDGSPSITASEIKFPNGAVTESPSGTANISFPSLVVNAGTDRSTDKLVITDSGTVTISETSYDAPSKTLTINFDGASGGGGGVSAAGLWNPYIAPSDLAPLEEFLFPNGGTPPTTFQPKVGLTVAQDLYGLRVVVTHESGTVRWRGAIITESAGGVLADNECFHALIHLQTDLLSSVAAGIEVGIALVEDATGAPNTSDIWACSIERGGPNYRAAYRTRASWDTPTVATVQATGNAYAHGWIHAWIGRRGTSYDFAFSFDALTWQRVHTVTIPTPPKSLNFMLSNFDSGNPDLIGRCRFIRKYNVGGAFRPLGRYL